MFSNPFGDGLLVIVVLLLFFGPKRLPMLSRSIGQSIKEFKGGIEEGSSSEDSKTELTSGETTSAPRQTAGTSADHTV
jgi:sec-independent protein translocase protein TatA